MIKMVRDGSFILVTEHSVNFFKSRGYSVVEEEPIKTEEPEITSHTEPKKAKSK
jgi:hypothetical protein